MIEIVINMSEQYIKINKNWLGDFPQNCESDAIYIGSGYKRVIIFDGDQEIDLIATIKDLTIKLEELQTHIDYMPGGRCYYEAKASFELALN
jgi:hypothetical protein